MAAMLGKIFVWFIVISSTSGCDLFWSFAQPLKISKGLGQDTNYSQEEFHAVIGDVRVSINGVYGTESHGWWFGIWVKRWVDFRIRVMNIGINELSIQPPTCTLTAGTTMYPMAGISENNDFTERDEVGKQIIQPKESSMSSVNFSSIPNSYDRKPLLLRCTFRNLTHGKVVPVESHWIMGANE